MIYFDKYMDEIGHVTEEHAMKIMKDGITDPFQVMEMLEWKLGRINYSLSDEKGEVCYTHGEEMERYETKTRSGTIYARKLCEYIANHYDQLTRKSPEEIYAELVDLGIDNLGVVYTLTLVFFITKGQSPIYDQFAAKSLKAIMCEKKPGQIVKYNNLANKSKASVNAVMEGYNDYIADLEAVFGDDYKTDRRIDQALWVYGHSFFGNEQLVHQRKTSNN